MTKPLIDSDPEHRALECARRGRARWPDLEIDPSLLAAHLEKRLGTSADGEVAYAEDLYLAIGCSLGIDQAIVAFEERFLARVSHFVRNLGDASFRDEVTQSMRIRLLVGGANSDGKIAAYRGDVPLMSWLRVSAIRTALNLKRGQRYSVPVDDLLSNEMTPELEYLKRASRRDFRSVFASSISSLSNEDRNLLRLHYVDQVGIDELGSMYALHRSTVARRIAAIRARLLHQTIGALRIRLKLSVPEVWGLIGLIRSNWSVSLGQLMQSEVD
jgi:RNA polymerase sigma-70 factor (ECF subfamily)